MAETKERTVREAFAQELFEEEAKWAQAGKNGTFTISPELEKKMEQFKKDKPLVALWGGGNEQRIPWETFDDPKVEFAIKHRDPVWIIDKLRPLGFHVKPMEHLLLAQLFRSQQYD